MKCHVAHASNYVTFADQLLSCKLWRQLSVRRGSIIVAAMYAVICEGFFATWKISNHFSNTALSLVNH